jgi:hypothetical protein
LQPGAWACHLALPSPLLLPTLCSLQQLRWWLGIGSATCDSSRLCSQTCRVGWRPRNSIPGDLRPVPSWDQAGSRLFLSWLRRGHHPLQGPSCPTLASPKSGAKQGLGTGRSLLSELLGLGYILLRALGGRHSLSAYCVPS